MKYSDAQLRSKVIAHLKAANYDALSLKVIRQALEKELGNDLSEKRDLIKQCVNKFSDEDVRQITNKN
jgi:glucose-6-phosphate 1-dehydrogenase